jgi:hypothetical protein
MLKFGKIDRHDITEILLKVALSTLNQPLFLFMTFISAILACLKRGNISLV